MRIELAEQQPGSPCIQVGRIRGHGTQSVTNFVSDFDGGLLVGLDPLTRGKSCTMLSVGQFRNSQRLSVLDEQVGEPGVRVAEGEADWKYDWWLISKFPREGRSVQCRAHRTGAEPDDMPL